MGVRGAGRTGKGKLMEGFHQSEFRVSKKIRQSILKANKQRKINKWDKLINFEQFQ